LLNIINSRFYRDIYLFFVRKRSTRSLNCNNSRYHHDILFGMYDTRIAFS